MIKLAIAVPLALTILVAVPSSARQVPDQHRRALQPSLDCFHAPNAVNVYPRYIVRNDCGVPVEIRWCWKLALKGWQHERNVCANTGMLRTMVRPDEVFEFANRPYDPKSKRSAMLTVEKICDVSGKKHCS